MFPEVGSSSLCRAKGPGSHSQVRGSWGESGGGGCAASEDVVESLQILQEQLFKYLRGEGTQPSHSVRSWLPDQDLG